MLAVESRLRELGMDVTEVTFSGRMLAFGDAYLSADAVLSWPDAADIDAADIDAADTVEKGTTLAVVDGTLTVNGQPRAPDIFSQRSNNKYLFHRPDINSVVIVIPSTAAASFLVGMFQQASAAIRDAANDCLAAVQVMTENQWNALSFNIRRQHKPIFVRYGSVGTVCPDDFTARACALYPRLETRDFGDAALATRMVPGTRIGVVDSAINSNNTENVGILMHELMHTLGVAHPSDPGSTKVTQTSSVNTVSSVMQNCVPGSVGCNLTFTLSPDDVDVIDTLYSPQPGGSCAYAFGLKILVAN